MSQVNSLTINDGATSPVSHAFAVYDRDGTKSVFRTSASALIAGALQLLHSVSLGTTKNSANRVSMTFIYPIEVTDENTGKTSVDSTSTAKVDINFAQALSADDRKAFYGLIVNALSHSDVKAQNIAVSPLS